MVLPDSVVMLILAFTIAFVKEGKIDDVVSVLNNYHEDIKFTHETEENCIIPFLDVSMQRTEENTLRLKVYHKKTSPSTGIPLHLIIGK